MFVGIEPGSGLPARGGEHAQGEFSSATDRQNPERRAKTLLRVHSKTYYSSPPLRHLDSDHLTAGIMEGIHCIRQEKGSVISAITPKPSLDEVEAVV